jgi:hypothetical protein
MAFLSIFRVQYWHDARWDDMSLTTTLSGENSGNSLKQVEEINIKGPDR